MEWVLYVGVLVILGGLFFASAVWALGWASRDGQLKHFDKGARVIFNEDEPEGVQTDFFPGKKGKKDARKLASPQADSEQPKPVDR